MNLDELIKLTNRENIKTHTILPSSKVIAHNIFELTKTGGLIILGVDITKFNDGRVKFNKITNMKGFYVDEIIDKALKRFSLPINMRDNEYNIEDKKIVVIKVHKDKNVKTKLLRLWVNMRSEYLEEGIYGSYIEYMGQMMMLEKILMEMYNVEEFPESFIDGLNISPKTCPTCNQETS